MKSSGKYSQCAFRLSLISVGFVLLAILGVVFSSFGTSENRSIIPGLAILISSIFAVIGLINSLLGIKEKNTVKKIIGISINFSITVLFVAVMVVNAIDIYNASN